MGGPEGSNGGGLASVWKLALNRQEARLLTDAPPAPPWTLDVEHALAALVGSPHGLSEVEAAERLRRWGGNVIEREQETSLLRIVLRQFQSPLIYILMLSALLTAVLRELTDTAIIGGVLVLNATVGSFQEYRAGRALSALRRLTVPRATVLRGGREEEIDSRHIVPGDLVLVASGSRVPADARLVLATDLQTDESLLTGESTVVEKQVDPLSDAETPLAERTNMLYTGTTVTRGRGHALVVATGMATELGRIAGELKTAAEPVTPLRRRMDVFARIIGLAIVGACAVAFPLGVALGESVRIMVRTVIALIVAAIPEGLPVVMTLALAIGVGRMARRKAIIRSLPAVETLGSCTVIASDKTGTLTENRMTVQAVWVAAKTLDVTGTGYDLEGRIQEEGVPVEVKQGSPLHHLLLGAVLGNEASLWLEEEGVKTAGDPTEVALLILGAKAGIFRADAEETFPCTATLPFESDRRFSATVRRHPEGGWVTFVKGSLERVMAMCDRVAALEGSLAKWQAKIEAVNATVAGRGLRVLAFATRRDRSEEAPELHSNLSGLELTGLVAMMDPPRPEVPAAVAACRKAGIRILMITGDHAATALAIAEQVGMVRGRAVEGREVGRAQEGDLEALCRENAVFARVEPAHKLRIVQTIRRLGDIVAVTGDGVNDAPALRAADIGVAMGGRGTDVAREAADIVVTDDNFATIVAAVEEGRVVFDNVRNVTFFLLSTGVAVVIAIFAAIIAGFPLPLLPAQIIWVNLVTNGIQDVALAFEPGEKDVLQRRPRPPGEGVLSAVLWERTALVGAVIAVATLSFFLTEYYVSDETLERARTMALTTMVVFQAVHVGNSRSEHLSAFRKSPISNPFLFVGTLTALLIHTGALYWGPTQTILEVEPLTLAEWARILAASLSVVAVVEVHKLLRRPAWLREGNAAPSPVASPE
jgi:Ca2+-transporting ATPase